MDLPSYPRRDVDRRISARGIRSRGRWLSRCDSFEPETFNPIPRTIMSQDKQSESTWVVETTPETFDKDVIVNILDVPINIAREISFCSGHKIVAN